MLLSDDRLICLCIDYNSHLFLGTYALKPPLPAVGGGDGVGKVVAVGDQVKRLKLGDLVRYVNPSLEQKGLRFFHSLKNVGHSYEPVSNEYSHATSFINSTQLKLTETS